jgi:DNA mismatch repair protein PMS2
MEFLQQMPGETVLQEYGIPEVLASTEYPFQLEGCISSCAHGQGRSATDRQFFYVNSRPCEPTKVKSKTFVCYTSDTRNKSSHGDVRGAKVYEDCACFLC